MRRRLLATTIISGAVLMAALPAFAQQAQPEAEPEAVQIDEVVVTGSRIRRDPASAPTALIQVQKEDLARTGQTTIIEYLATIPALANSQLPADTTAGLLNAGGLSLPNLRALGANRTLTLVDGRRHVGSPQGGLQVDIDTIPRLLIENVEIITGGASSVYGTDAVSGVLNFVLDRDFEGLEIDTRYAQTNQDGQAQVRIGALAGVNLLDDRLNLYAFGEYERADEVLAEDLDWLREGWGFTGLDLDPTSPNADGVEDTRLYRDRRTLQLLRWGQVTLANNYQPTPLSDPDIAPTGQCSSFVAVPCFGVAPGRTYVFDGLAARPANFGVQLSQTGTNRAIVQGGDGENPNTVFNVDAVYPESISKRFQVGANFSISPAFNLHAETKFIDEETNLATGLSFGDTYISNTYATNDSLPLQGASNAWNISLNDNAFLPANLRAAILSNTTPVYCLTTAGCAGGVAYGQQTGVTAAPFARWSAWLLDRPQTNYKTLERHVLSADGDLGNILFFRDVNYDIGYTYGRVDNQNFESGIDGERVAYASDAVVDNAGVVNGHPGEIVCRVQLLTAGGGTVTNRNAFNPTTGAGVGPAQIGRTDPDIAGCRPLNIFGLGNQSQESLDYIRATISIDQENVQEDWLGSVSARLWDFWGAGSIGVAVGAELRSESTEGTGRSQSVAGRLLQLNTGADFLPASYDTEEYFGEISVPLLRNSWAGDYAEISGSYRQSDFSTFGKSDVYGINLVYRPIPDITLRTSLNTSVRAPSLGESFAPQTQTFLNTFVDPCDSVVNRDLGDRTIAGHRVVNCEALAASLGLAGVFNFTDPNAANAYRGVYPSGIPGVNGGNPTLRPEESESFTFSTVFRPRFIPNLNLVLDYYEIEIDGVIAAVTAGVAANNCVDGPALNTPACDTLTRSAVNDPTTPRDDRLHLVGFIQGSINYAKRTVRGMDFTANYQLETEDLIGRDWGQLNYRLAGSWLMEQKQFNNISNPADYTTQDGTIFFPRVRFTSSLTWSPTDKLSFTWDADFMTAQDVIQARDFISNVDQRSTRYLDTGNFVRQDFTVRYDMSDEVTLRAGVVNAFDEEQSPWLGATVLTHMDPFGRRFSIGLNWRPY